jgi:hypothetical protein
MEILLEFSDSSEDQCIHYRKFKVVKFSALPGKGNRKSLLLGFVYSRLNALLFYLLLLIPIILSSARFAWQCRKFNNLELAIMDTLILT